MPKLKVARLKKDEQSFVRWFLGKDVRFKFTNFAVWGALAYHLYAIFTGHPSYSGVTKALSPFLLFVVFPMFVWLTHKEYKKDTN